MASERKTVMISVRLAADLVARVDYITRNTEGDAKNRSAAVLAAIEMWLSGQEERLVQLGVLTKKAR